MLADMRRSPEELADDDVVLIQIARRLSEAKAVEELLTAAAIDYLVVPDKYHATFLFIFPTERIGAFFYVRPADEQACRSLLTENRFQVVDAAG